MRLSLIVWILLGLFVMQHSAMGFAEELDLDTVAEESSVSKPTTPNREQVGTVNVGGGEKTIKVIHPNAAKGLLRIKKDGSYQYKVPLKEKSQSSTFGLTSFTSPRIRNAQVSTTYANMYGGDPVGFMFNYEWMPFRRFGMLGLVVESGLSTAVGRGKFADGSQANESYYLLMIPLGAFIKYRFEYMKRQWVVPYVLGGGIYYGLIEKRDDDKIINAGAMAIGGGGGLQLNLSRLDPEGLYRLDREWGIADLWLTFEMRVMQGLKPEMDFTNTTLLGGITMDF